jgi:hypothetical protein
MTPAAEAGYALDFNVSRDDLKPEVQAEYDRLLQVRQEATHALDFNVSRDDLKPEVQAEYDRISKVAACQPAPKSGMTVDAATGTVTVWERGTAILYSDDHGVTVRKPLANSRRVAWAEISRFEDGGGYDSQSGGRFWTLVIVLHTGQKVATRAIAGAPAPETLTAVRRIAELHGIAADVAGVPMRDGRPVKRGLYHDPGGQAGLRYWDGTQWSPLLPLDIVSPRRLKAQESPASWSALPTADGNWPYAAARATRLIAWFAVFAAASAALVAAALVVYRLGWDHGTNDNNPSTLAWLGAAICAGRALAALRERKLLLKLDRAIGR